jgi:ATP adenylyltransferase
MEILWAPWRKYYVVSASGSKSNECIFCRATQGSDESNYVIYRGSYSLAMLNKYPYNNAHVMVSPLKHVPTPELLNDEELLDLIRTVNIILSAIRLCYNPDGFNIGANIGRAAGAGIEGHLHIHIVPRWNGDTNFMAVIANTKVIPEGLNETFVKLRECINKIKIPTSSK